jgi:tRNA U34 2-thiouridine synthase MnmA/TrmU
MPALESNVEESSCGCEWKYHWQTPWLSFLYNRPAKGSSRFGKPVYVTAIDPENNTVVLGEEKDLAVIHDGNRISYRNTNWPDGMEAITKIRYKDKGAEQYLCRGSQLQVHFHNRSKYRTRTKRCFL